MSTPTLTTSQSEHMETVRSLLTPFLEEHPEVTLEWRTVRKETKESLCLNKPWGDEGLIFVLPEDLDEFADVLNNVLLPNRYTALWHKDTKFFEIIWTAYPLSDSSLEMKGREFSFTLDSETHTCKFGQSSGRLLSLARNAVPVAMSHSGHRNLQSFQIYLRHVENNSDDSPKGPPVGEPISFWISDVEWNEDKVLKLIGHLNFYLTYYDSLSPTIYIHSPPEEKPKITNRYRLEKFPSHVDAHQIEDDLLQLWMAAREGDAARRFIYYYRIIEYASHAHIDREARRLVLQLLSQPHARSNVSELVDEVVSAALLKSIDDIPKIGNLLRDVVRIEVLWEELERNKSAFTEDVEFDGGFQLGALISESATLETFKKNGMIQFATHARSIRNHLSHGRDRATQAAIIPTVENFRRLEPWTSAIATLAGEVLIFRNLHKVI